MVVNFTPPLVNRRTDEVAAAIVAAVDRSAAAGDAGAARREPPTWRKPVVASLLGADECRAGHPALGPLPGAELHVPGNGGESAGPRPSVRGVAGPAERDRPGARPTSTSTRPGGGCPTRKSTEPRRACPRAG